MFALVNSSAYTLAGDTAQPSYTQKRTVKRECRNRGYSANFLALKLSSHVRFCVRDGHVPSPARGDTKN
jgi:hypothetical protein